MNDQRAKGSWRSLLDGIASIAITAAAAAIVWSIVEARRTPAGPDIRSPRVSESRRQAGPPSEPISLVDAAVRGNPKAAVAVIEYSDFQCPFCGTFARDTLPAIEKAYVDSGRVLMAYRHMPLGTLHPLATKAAEAAECARRQGRFWPLHDRFFLNQQKLDEESIRLSARDVGLEPSSFDACLSREAQENVHRDVIDAQKLGVTGTPTFLLGRVQEDGRVKATRSLSGALPFAQFRNEIESLLAADVASAR